MTHARPRGTPAALLVAPLAAFLAALALGACSAPVRIAPVNITAAELGSTRIPGRYAVYLQTGAWQVEVENEAFHCAAWSFDTDFDGAFRSTAQDAFRTAFESVAFTPRTLEPAEIEARGLDAQILLYQGSVRASYSIAPRFFTVTVNAAAIVDGIVALTDPAGLAYQGRAEGNGSFSKRMADRCDLAGQVVAEAGAKAIKDFVIEAVRQAREKVLEMKLKAAAAG